MSSRSTAIAAPADEAANDGGGGGAAAAASPKGGSSWYSGFLKLPVVESMARVAKEVSQAARETVDQALAVEEVEYESASDSDSAEFMDTVESADVREVRNLKKMMTDMEVQHISATKEYQKMFHIYRTEQDALMNIIKSKTPDPAAVLEDIGREFAAASARSAPVSETADELKLFKAQCRQLVQTKVDLQARLTAESDSVATLEGSAKSLRTELANANSALENFFEEKSRFHDDKRKLGVEHEESLDRMAEDYNKAVAAAAANSAKAQETIATLEAKEAEAQAKLAETSAELHRQLALAAARTPTPSTTTADERAPATLAAEERLAKEVAECTKLQELLAAKEKDQSLERETLEQSVNKFRTLAERHSTAVDALRRELAEQGKTEREAESVNNLEIQRKISELEHVVEEHQQKARHTQQQHLEAVKALESQEATELANLATALADASEKATEELEGERTRAAAETAHLTTQLSEAQDARKQALAAVHAKEEALERSLLEQKQASANLEKSLEAAHGASSSVATELQSALATKSSQLESAQNKLANEQAELQSLADRSSSEEESLKSTISKLEGMLAEGRASAEAEREHASEVAASAEKQASQLADCLQEVAQEANLVEEWQARSEKAELKLSEAENISAAAAKTTTAEIEELRQEHADAVARSETLQRNILKASEDGEAQTAAEAAVAAARIENLQSELQASANKAAAVASSLQEAEAEKQNLEASQQELKIQLDSAQAELAEAEAAAAKADESAQRTATELENNIAALTQQGVTSEQAASQALQDAKAQLASLRDEISAQRTSAEEARTALQEELASLRVAREEDRAAASEEASAAATAASEAQETLRQSLSSEIAEAERARASLEGELKVALNQAEASASAAQQELAKKQQSAEVLTSELQAQQAAADEAAATARELLDETKQSLVSEIADTQRELHELQISREATESSLQAIQAEHNNLESAHAALESQSAESAASAARALQQVEAELASAIQKASHHESELETLISEKVEMIETLTKTVSDQESSAAAAANAAQVAAAETRSAHEQELAATVERQKAEAQAQLKVVTAEFDEQSATAQAEHNRQLTLQEERAATQAAEATARINGLTSERDSLNKRVADLIVEHEAALVALRAKLQSEFDAAKAERQAQFEEQQRQQAKLAADALAAEKAAAAATLEAQENEAEARRVEAKAASDAAVKAANDEAAKQAQLLDELRAKAAQDIAMARAQAASEARKAMRGEIEDAYKKYNEEVLRRKKVHNKLMQIQGNIQVICRVRPVLPHEQAQDSVMSRSCFEFPIENDVILESEDGTTRRFEFDRAFAGNATQEQIFDSVEGLTTSVTDGYDVCIFAYGQTGSGKTFTMEGPAENPGINRRALSAIFAKAAKAPEALEFSLEMSMLQIYNEKVQDLLADAKASGAKTSLDIKRGPRGNYVDGLIWETVHNMDEVELNMTKGASNRNVGSHSINEFSSRSHLVLSLRCSTSNSITGAKSRGLLHLIDLAGSERLSKTDATGSRLTEAKSINKSLSALGDVVASLAQRGSKKGGHVPFRNSKLTYLLESSLGGDSKVLMVVNCSPVMWNSQETLCSLNFAKRCRSIQLGKATKHGSNPEVVKLRAELAALKDELRSRAIITRTRTPEKRGGSRR